MVRRNRLSVSGVDMKQPKFTDTHRFAVPYRKAAETDITQTFKRARADQAKNQAEIAEKVAPLRKAK